MLSTAMLKWHHSINGEETGSLVDYQKFTSRNFKLRGCFLLFFLVEGWELQLTTLSPQINKWCIFTSSEVYSHSYRFNKLMCQYVDGSKVDTSLYILKPSKVKKFQSRNSSLRDGSKKKKSRVAKVFVSEPVRPNWHSGIFLVQVVGHKMSILYTVCHQKWKFNWAFVDAHQIEIIFVQQSLKKKEDDIDVWCLAVLLLVQFVPGSVVYTHSSRHCVVFVQDRFRPH